MTRRNLLQILFGAAAGAQAACGDAGKDTARAVEELAPDVGTLVKTPAEWRGVLEPAAYRVLREEGTERPGSSVLNKEKRPGTYVCAGCFLPLFDARHKFDSGTGWPSFFDALPGHLGTKTDRSLFEQRTEYHCLRCGGHQGHVFNDGPAPTGLRYCNNGVAIAFVPEGEALPELRA